LYSLHVTNKSGGLLLERKLENLVVFLAELVVELLLEVWPFAFGLLLGSFFGEVIEFFRQLTSHDELAHQIHVLLSHIGRVCWILSLQKEREELEHGLLDTQIWILESVFGNFSESSGHNRAESLLHEGG